MRITTEQNTFEEWLSSELESMNFPLQHILPSVEHSPTKSVGRGENDCAIYRLHTLLKMSHYQTCEKHGRGGGN